MKMTKWNRSLQEFLDEVTLALDSGVPAEEAGAPQQDGLIYLGEQKEEHLWER